MVPLLGPSPKRHSPINVDPMRMQLWLNDMVTKHPDLTFDFGPYYNCIKRSKKADGASLWRLREYVQDIVTKVNDKAKLPTQALAMMLISMATATSFKHRLFLRGSTARTWQP